MVPKPILRKLMKRKTEQLSYEDKSFYSNKIAAKLYKNKEFLDAQTVFLYYSTPNEVFTKAILMTSLIMKKQVYMPVVKDDGMHAVLVDTSTQYTLNCWDINEPIYKDKFNDDVKFDVIIVPLLAFDKNKNRLGRGKAYYDKYLKGKRSFKIALAYSCQELDEVPKEKHDVAMDVVITENNIYQ